MAVFSREEVLVDLGRVMSDLADTVETELGQLTVLSFLASGNPGWTRRSLPCWVIQATEVKKSWWRHRPSVVSRPIVWVESDVDGMRQMFAGVLDSRVLEMVKTELEAFKIKHGLVRITLNTPQSFECWQA